MHELHALIEMSPSSRSRTSAADCTVDGVSLIDDHSQLHAQRWAACVLMRCIRHNDWIGSASQDT